MAQKRIDLSSAFGSGGDQTTPAAENPHRRILIGRNVVSESGPAARRSFTISADDLQKARNHTLVISEIDLPGKCPRIVILGEEVKRTKPLVLVTLEDVGSQLLRQGLRLRAIVVDESDFLGSFEDENYHGTRSGQNVETILERGWMVGPGNACGSGVYFAFGGQNGSSSFLRSLLGGQGGRSMASGYASFGGAIIKARIAWGRMADWRDQTTVSSCMNWLSERGKSYNGDTITEWGLANGYDSVNSGAGYGVLLHPQYALTGEYWKTPRIQVTEVYYSNGRAEPIS